MTGNAINAKSEALELRGLSSEELDTVSGGSWFAEFCEELLAAANFAKALQQASSI
jgi:hypothetical protein